LLVGARNGAIKVGGEGYLDASTVVRRLGVPDAPISRAEGDVHPGGNPHYICDPRAGVRVVAAIADRLSAIDPANAAVYRRNGAELMEELRAVASEVRARFNALPADKRRVVAYHDSLVYLNDWLGLDQIITIEPKAGIPPNPAHVARVLATMKSTGVRVILQEQFYPRNTSETLAKLAGGRLVVLDAATHFDREQRYVDHVREMARKVYDALAQ
jgi:zinc/manganese transport system substrate-binding protein